MARPLLRARAAWEDVAQQLAERLRGTRDPRLEVEALIPWEGAAALGAIDGGGAVVLEGGGLAVGAVRTAALAWRAHAPVHELPSELEVRLLDDALAQDLRATAPGLPPAEGSAALLERWRAHREWQAGMALVRQLGEGDLLAMDGSLAPREWDGAMRNALRDACGARGVGLVGVCKSSSATLDGAPALWAASRAARGVPEPWAAPLPRASDGTRAWAVRFLRGARVFQVEVAPPAHPADVLGRLAPWTRDAGYAGYPYPLALAHNRCALDAATVEDLGHTLRALAQAHGAGPEAWEQVFGDYHEVLDRGL